jgi:hypothetical protein
MVTAAKLTGDPHLGNLDRFVITVKTSIRLVSSAVSEPGQYHDMGWVFGTVSSPFFR